MLLPVSNVTPSPKSENSHTATLNDKLRACTLRVNENYFVLVFS